MAFLTCNFYSEILSKTVEFNATIPEGCENGAKTLYLLHGFTENSTAWSRFSSIERYAKLNKIAVIMPDAGKSFYTDMAYGDKYFTHIAYEIVEYTRKLFNLSNRRDDTFIAGLSMGGYGAVKIALRRPDIFSAAASLSGCLDIEGIIDMEPLLSKVILGENHDLSQSPENVIYLVEKMKDAPIKPKIYQAIGKSDFLYDGNQKFKEAIEKTDFEYFYEEGIGDHTWDFWDKYIQKAINYILE